ncbi:hypothetical protein ACFL5O_03935 [Myxococcota bacterium]
MRGCMPQIRAHLARPMTLSSMGKNLLRYLIGPTLASGVGLAAGVLGQVPEPVVVGVLTQAWGSDWEDEGRTRLLSVLAADPREPVRWAVADAIGGGGEWDSELLDILQKLAADSAACVRNAAAAALPILLESATILRRLEVIAAWAVSAETGLRVAASRALASTLTIPAADLVLELLASDRNPEVRRGALMAVRERFSLFSDVACRISEPCLYDPQPSVRRLARRLFVQSQAQA